MSNEVKTSGSVNYLRVEPPTTAMSKESEKRIYQIVRKVLEEGGLLKPTAFPNITDDQLYDAVKKTAIAEFKSIAQHLEIDLTNDDHLSMLKKRLREHELIIQEGSTWSKEHEGYQLSTPTRRIV